MWLHYWYKQQNPPLSDTTWSVSVFLVLTCEVESVITLFIFEPWSTVPTRNQGLRMERLLRQQRQPLLLPKVWHLPPSLVCRMMWIWVMAKTGRPWITFQGWNFWRPNWTRTGFDPCPRRASSATFQRPCYRPPLCHNGGRNGKCK